jgi:integrase
MDGQAAAGFDSQLDSHQQRTPTAAGGHRRTGRGGKRGNAEGSVYQRKDGRWVAQVRQLGGPRVYRYARTRTEAATKLTELLKAASVGLPMPPERQTVGAYLVEWLETTAKPGLRPTTYVSYAGVVRVHLVPELGSLRLSRLTPQHVQALMNRKLEAGLSPLRVDYLRRVLRRALNDALRWGLVARNVATLVRPPRRQRVEIRPLDPAQARTFLGAIRGDRLEALYSVALAVGLRQGEALGLRWEDVDLVAGVIRVRKALQRIDGRFQLVDPKSPRSRRTVTLPAVVVEALRAHRTRQEGERRRAGTEWEDWSLVFTTPLGRPLDASNVTHVFQRHLERAGLPRQRFHDLRHACASLLLAQGVSPRVVMEVLGHSQITLTLDTYSHVIPALQADAAARMDALLRAQG